MRMQLSDAKPRDWEWYTIDPISGVVSRSKTAKALIADLRGEPRKLDGGGFRVGPFYVLRGSQLRDRGLYAVALRSMRGRDNIGNPVGNVSEGFYPDKYRLPQRRITRPSHQAFPTAKRVKTRRPVRRPTENEASKSLFQSAASQPAARTR